MEKWMCIGGIAVAGLFLVVFLLDLIIGFPFGSATPADKGNPFLMVDIFGLLSCGILGYLGVNALRDIKS